MFCFINSLTNINIYCFKNNKYYQIINLYIKDLFGDGLIFI